MDAISKKSTVAVVMILLGIAVTLVSSTSCSCGGARANQSVEALTVVTTVSDSLGVKHPIPGSSASYVRSIAGAL